MTVAGNVLQAIAMWCATLAHTVYVSSLYPYVLGSTVLSILLGVVNVALAILSRPSGKRNPARALWIELRFLVASELYPIALLWLAFATPVDRLPFAPPLRGHWLFLPAQPAYVVLAVLLHGAISLYGAFDLATSWLVQLHTPNMSRIDAFALTVTLLAVVYGWEV